MNKMKKILLYIGIAAIVAACTKGEVDDSANDGGVVQFTTTSEITRSVEKKQWSVGEAIGVYDGTGLYNNIGYEVMNIEESDGTTTFDPVDAAKEVYFSHILTSQTFYAYYPYNESVTGNIVPLDLSTSQEDVLWSSASSEQSSGFVDFEFDHVLSLIEIEVTAIGDVILPSSADKMRIFLGGSITNGSFEICTDDLAKGLCIGSDTNHIETTIEEGAGDSSSYTTTAIVMPNDYSASDVTIYYEIDGRAFHNEFRPTWRSGYKYKYKAEVGTTEVRFTLDSIEPWGDATTSDALLSGYDMVISRVGEDPGVDLCEIYTAKGLAAFRDLVNGAGENTTGANVKSSNIEIVYSYDTKNRSLNAKLMNDIDLREICNETNGVSWSPIGLNSYNAYYSGTFDGDSYEVQGLYINVNEMYQGLFGCTLGATIKSVGVTGSVTGKGGVGGLVGQSGNADVIYNCYSNATVKGSGAGIGGLIGYSFDDNNIISNCYSNGSVSGDVYVGGFVGANQGNISNCYCAATVSGDGYVGGFVGLVESTSVVADCYYNAMYYGGDGYGLEYSTSDITGYSTSEMKAEVFLNELKSNAALESVTISGICSWKTGDNGYPILDFERLATDN